jgi:hypothetical protein
MWTAAVEIDLNFLSEINASRIFYKYFVSGFKEMDGVHQWETYELFFWL